MIFTCKREVDMNFNPYGLGLWSGLPIWLTGWMSLMALDTPTANRVLATLMAAWTAGAVAIAGCIMAVFDHKAAGCKLCHRAEFCRSILSLSPSVRREVKGPSEFLLWFCCFC